MVVLADVLVRQTLSVFFVDLIDRRQCAFRCRLDTSLRFNGVGNLLVLEFVQQLHQEEGKLYLVFAFEVLFFYVGICNADFDEVFGSDVRSIVSKLLSLCLESFT